MRKIIRGSKISKGIFIFVPSKTLKFVQILEFRILVPLDPDLNGSYFFTWKHVKWMMFKCWEIFLENDDWCQLSPKFFWEALMNIDGIQALSIDTRIRTRWVESIPSPGFFRFKNLSSFRMLCYKDILLIIESYRQIWI